MIVQAYPIARQGAWVDAQGTVEDRSRLKRPPEVVAVVGPPGPAARGFGSVDYTDTDSGTPLVLGVDQWVRVARNLVPSTANFNPLSAPFVGFQFYDGGKLRARARGDLYLFKFAFAVMSSTRGGVLSLAVRPNDDPAFDFGPEPITLALDAGVVQPGSATFFTQARSRFVTSGASIYARLSVGGHLLTFSPEITPLGYAS